MGEIGVLAPLDGSRAGEAALPFLTPLRSVGALRVRLVTVYEPPDETTRATGGVHRDLREIERYLKGVAARVGRAAEAEVETVAAVGVPFQEILRQAEDPAVHLVLVAGAGGAGRRAGRVLGSVADKVVRGASCPVLVVGAGAVERGAPLSLQSVLVPLDGSALAEEALPIARAVVERTEGRLHLVRVTPPLPSPEEGPLGSLTADLIESEALTASMYLDEVAQELETARPVTRSAPQGPVVEELAAFARDQGVDLVVMTSHGRHGLLRWALGSVTEGLLPGPAPVLVLKPEGESLARLAAVLADADP